MQALSTTVPGHSYTIKWMFGLPEVIDFIKNCQIEEGCLIHVLQKSSAGLIIKSRAVSYTHLKYEYIVNFV